MFLYEKILQMNREVKKNLIKQNKRKLEKEYGIKTHVDVLYKSIRHSDCMNGFGKNFVPHIAIGIQDTNNPQLILAVFFHEFAHALYDSGRKSLMWFVIHKASRTLSYFLKFVIVVLLLFQNPITHKNFWFACIIVSITPMLFSEIRAWVFSFKRLKKVFSTHFSFIKIYTIAFVALSSYLLAPLSLMLLIYFFH